MGIISRLQDILKSRMAYITADKTCDKSSLRDAVRRSFANWKVFKKECANSYIYVTKEYYLFRGYYKNISVVVEKGKVVRAYKHETKHSFGVNSTPKFDSKILGRKSKKDELQQELEEKRPLTTSEIKELKTLDEIYVFAKRLRWVLKPYTKIGFKNAT